MNYKLGAKFSLADHLSIHIRHSTNLNWDHSAGCILQTQIN